VLGADNIEICIWSIYWVRADNWDYLFFGQLLRFGGGPSYPVDGMLSTLGEEIGDLAAEIASRTENQNFGHFE
jgi:hypothetical protein